MHCYVIETGYMYDGGSVDKVTLSYDTALFYCLQYIEERRGYDIKNNVEHRKRYTEMVRQNPMEFGYNNIEEFLEDLENDMFDEYEPWEEDDSRNTKEENHFWTNNSDYIRIKKMEMI